MSVITQVVNPADDSTALKAKGILKRVIVKRINEDGSPKITKGPNGPIKNTHRYTLIISDPEGGDDAMIGFGEGEVKNLKYEHQFQIKDGNAYKDLIPGQEISVYPLTSREYNGKTYYDGRRKAIKILTDAPEGSTPSQPQSQAPAASGGNKGTKIYGEIVKIEGNLASVNDEKIGVGEVVLSDEQLAEVQVGGRLAAFVDTSNGSIINGFKAYGPVGSSSGGGNKKGGNNYDAVGVATGHAINARWELINRGYKCDDEVELCAVIHRVSLELKAFVAERTGKGIDTNSVGAAAGNAVINGCRHVNVKSKNIETDLVQASKDVYTTLSEPVYAFIEGFGKAEPQKPAESVPEPLNNTVVNAPPVVDDYEPPIDFDDDIPFAPIGLQYPNHAIYVL